MTLLIALLLGINPRLVVVYWLLATKVPLLSTLKHVSREALVSSPFILVSYFLDILELSSAFHFYSQELLITPNEF